MKHPTDSSSFGRIIYTKIYEICVQCQLLSSVGYIEIFDEVIYDLLNRRQTVNITRNSGSEIKLSNKEIIIKDVATILKLLQKGNERITQKSSAQAQRLTSSHTIFQIVSKNVISFIASIISFISFIR